MAHFSLANGPESEVIADFPDGYSYSRNKLDASLEKIKSQFKKTSKPKPVKYDAQVKEEVATIMNEFEIPRAQAEKVFSENGKDLGKALRVLIND